MRYRLWFPQLDVNDTVRRMSLILYSVHGRALTRERLYISDFYFANPPLLHKTHMPSNVRKAFTILGVRRPEATFINYPPAPILYAKMAGTQRLALHNLIGRNLVDIESIKNDHVILSEEGVNFARDVTARLLETDETPVLQFICSEFATIAVDQPGGLRTATGLRRIGQ